MTRSIRVLHLDDDPQFTSLTATFLQQEDDRFVVESAQRPSDAWDLLDGSVDCVVSDYEMPEQNGIEFLRRVRDEYGDLPFILFTGKGSETVASEAISAGVTDYLQKQRGSDQYTVLANRIENAVERRRLEAAHRETSERMDLALEHTDSILFEIALGTNEESRHGPVERLYGVPSEEMPTLDAFLERGVHPEDRQRVREFYGGLADGERWEGVVEYRTSPEHGDSRWLEATVSVEESDDGSRRALGLAQDVTERKEHEAEIDWHRTVIRNMGEGVYVLDAEYEFQFVNYRVQDVEGISEENWQGRRLSYLESIGVLDDEEVGEVRAGVDRILAGDADEVSVLFEPTVPESTWVGELRLRRLPRESGEDYVIGTTRDVTDRVRREQRLERYEELFETLPVGYFRSTPDGTIVDANETFADLLGAESPSALVGSSAREYYAQPQTRDEILETIEREGVVTNREAEVRTGTDDPRWVSATLTRTTIDGEEYLEGYVQDVTERVEGGRDLERVQRRLDVILQHTVTPTFLKDRSGEYVLVNRAYRSLHDLDEGEAVGRTDEEIHPPGLAEQFRDTHREVIEDGEPVRTERRLSIDGEARVFKTSVVPVETPIDADSGEAPTGVFGVADDVTERTRLQEALDRQNERLERFTSIVSHDLRNPLDMTDSWIELVREDCDSPHLDDLQSTVDRMHDRVEGLLEFAREGNRVGTLEPTELTTVVDRCWEVVDTSGATLRTDVDGVVRADRERLAQLLENLIRNCVEHGSTGSSPEADDSANRGAVDSRSAERGAGDGATGSRDSGGSDPRGSAESGGADAATDESAVTVTVGSLPDGFFVADDGPGFPDDPDEELFARGYSTRPGGTGYGLSIVETIAEAHGWDVDTSRSAEGGARVEVTGVEFVE